MMEALWLVILPIGLTPVVYLFRRSWLGAILAALIAFFLTWFTLQLSTGPILTVLGRTIALDSLSQVVLSLLFVTTGILFLALALFTFGKQEQEQGSRRHHSIKQESRIFYPAALIILGLFAAANLLHHLGIVAILVELAAILTVFVIQTERLESTRASLRFLILISLATPIFLLAAWQIDVSQLSGGADVGSNLEQIALLIGIGFAIWLAVIPFHGWLISTATESSPPMAAFVLITFPLIAFSALIHVLTDLPRLIDSVYLIDAMLLAGVFTAFLGGVLAAVQRGLSQLLGYAVLFNLGCILTVLSLGGRGTIITILVFLVVRALALLLIAISISTLYLRVTDDGFTQIKGLAQQMPIAVMGVAIGGLTLAGVPLTAGFPPYWQLLRSLAEVDSRWLILLVFGGLGVIMGYVRALGVMLNPPRPENDTTQRLSFQEPPLLLLLIISLSVVCIMLGLFPSLLIQPLQTISLPISLPIR